MDGLEKKGVGWWVLGEEIQSVKAAAVQTAEPRARI